MGQKYCKKINLEITHELHAEIKKQAEKRNITMRKLLLRCIIPIVLRNKQLNREYDEKF